MSNDEIIQGFDTETDEDLHLSLQRAGGVEAGLIVYLAGIITTHNALFFQKQGIKLIESGYTRLILHCGELTHISSTGLGSLLVLLKSVRSRGGELILAAMQPQVQDRLHLLGFAPVFIIRGSLDASLRVFRSMASVELVPAFPRILPCPVCSKKLDVLKQGRFRCGECKAILAIDKQGKVCLG